MGAFPSCGAQGGLADTVQDFDPRTGQGNGFSFEPYNSLALYTALTRAVENYKHQTTWRTLMLRGMTADFSWQASARKYVDLYYRRLESTNQKIYETLNRGSGEEG